MAISKGSIGKGGGQGPELDSNDQEFLSQIEKNIRSKDNEQEDARAEAEQRAREMERIRLASAKQQIPGVKSGQEQQTATKKPTELENDPRYREYFERLNRQKGGATPPSTSEKPSTAQRTPAKAGAPASQSIGPGSIVRFDDGSIGIYKDAVSGRDYALFYFLEPDGQFVPDGVFLQCYQAKLIGALPENYFEMLREKNEWDRDLILFHLAAFEHVDYLNKVARHEERKPKSTTPPKNASVAAPERQSAPSGPQEKPKDKTTTPPQNNSLQQKSPTQATPVPPVDEAPAEDEGQLVRGRKFQIKFGGKQWEAVYWANDAEGSIVAHSTHGHWSLMRLDLDRFKESLVPGDMVSDETLSQIAEDAAASK